MGLIIGIDASRNRSGGARNHLCGILAQLNTERYGIERVHVWAYRTLLDMLPTAPWLVKHNPAALEGALPFQILWQATELGRAARRCGCHVLYATDASTVGRFAPMVVFSQDLLSYEPGVMQAYGWTFARFRLQTILLLQNSSFRAADGVIFLTEYARKMIEKSCGQLRRTTCIPHGVDDSFRAINRLRAWPEPTERDIECVYVSNAALYKNQWHVIRGMALLRARGYRLKLVLIGGGSGRAWKLLHQARRETDPRGNWVESLEFLPHEALSARLAQADLCIFASACEAFGITLIEAMATGLPVACSNRSSLPEVSQGAAVYFDPESPSEIAAAVESIIRDPHLRQSLVMRAREVSAGYSWSRCTHETWSFIVDTANVYQARNS